MKLLLIGLALIASSVKLLPTAQEQRGHSQDKSAASISGHVTLRGEPVQGALILAIPEPPAGRERQMSAKTNADGQYQITNLPPGKYSIWAQAPGYVSQEGVAGEFGRDIRLESNDKPDNIDFALVRGGVITGRVSDAINEPVVDQSVSLTVLTARGWWPYSTPYSNYEMMTTDDRGVYRIYGLPPGRYKVGIGEGSGSTYRRLDYGENYYPLTYHPDAREESKARIVELSEGSEVSGIDIKVGRRERTYEASGRIVNAETGQPQPGIKWGYDGSAVSTFGAKSDGTGGFKISGLIPGRYSIFAGCEGDFYSDKVEFDVTDNGVIGLEIRRNKGAGLRGKVVVEGVSDPSTLGKLSQVTLSATGNLTSTVEPDGSFYFCGLRPGNVKISAYSWQPGFWLRRVERDGVDLSDGIEVSPGMQLSDLRVVLAYVTGVIRGQVTTLNYELPHNVRLQIVARRVGDEGSANILTAQTDDRGRFTFEGLAPGEYELSSGAIVVMGSVAQTPSLTRVKQKVSVSNGKESAVTLVLKLSER